MIFRSFCSKSPILLYLNTSTNVIYCLLRYLDATRYSRSCWNSHNNLIRLILQLIVLNNCIVKIVDLQKQRFKMSTHMHKLYLTQLSGWPSVNALAYHRCDPGSIPDVGMWDGHVVTKSDRWVSSGHSGFLPHEDHPNANIDANEHD